MSLKDYIDKPRKGWDDKKWLQHAHIQSHDPWISEEDRLYYKDKFTDLINKQSGGI